MPIEPTHWIETTAPCKLHTQSQVCQHKKCTAVTSHFFERQQIPMSPGCHFQVIKGLQYDTAVQNTSALHYEHNIRAKGKEGWEAGCSYAAWVWYSTAKISLILQVGLIKETKRGYWIQNRKMTQNAIEEPTGIWDQRPQEESALITHCGTQPCRILSCKTSPPIGGCA